MTTVVPPASPAPAVASPAPSLDVAPGSVVRVRDEDWLVTQVSMTSDGTLVTVQGLSELVRDTTAQFFAGIDRIVPVDPRRTRVIADASTRHRLSRLWLEATLRKTALPASSTDLAVVGDVLADPLAYQLTAVRQALDPANLRPRILLADTVGLGKTLEIGMILAELVRRGRGDRILIVTPRHVLEQMQHEMWSRFALPFVRLDSVGIQRVRRSVPASRNPFSVFHRAIISIDTLKSDRYLNHLRKQRWDAVVIDESHNITNKGTLNNRLADILARQTDALILASATPHNGDPKSFAELIRLLEPTAVRADGSLDEEAVRRLVIRRHRHSDEVRDVVGGRWKERLTPVNKLVEPSPAEDAVAGELSRTWLHGDDGASAPGGRTPTARGGGSLFAWTLAKSFLSSPAALIQTIDERLARRHSRATGPDGPEPSEQSQALARLRELAVEANTTASGKYQALLAELRRIGISRSSTERVVVFAERIATLTWLAEHLREDLRLPAEAVRVMHGSLSDVEQQEIVEQFRQAHTPVRVLVTGDVASEGVNLHAQCHELIHYDIPWSLIRIEQRNGRIDRYGQSVSPQITTLLLSPSDPRFSGDVRVLTRLMEKEDQAHRALGDAASLMGLYSGEREEAAIREALAAGEDIDEVVPDADDALALDPMAALFARLTGTAEARGGDADPTGPDGSPAPGDPSDSGDPDGPADSANAAVPATPTQPAAPLPTSTLYETQLDYLRQALTELYERPEEAEQRQTGGGGVSWREHGPQHVVEMVPPAGLRHRLSVLPQSYLRERRVQEHLLLATTQAKGARLLTEALRDSSDSSWPEAHYLGPLHPVLDWAGDRVLAKLGRSSVFAVRGDVDSPTVLLLGTLTNRAGRTVSMVCVSAAFPYLDPAAAGADLSAGRPVEAVAIGQVHDSPTAMFASAGISRQLRNSGPVTDTGLLEELISPAVDAAESQMALTVQAASRQAHARVEAWAEHANAWDDEAGLLIQNRHLREQRSTVAQERELMDQHLPAHTLVRPLLVVVPQDFGMEGDL